MSPCAAGTNGAPACAADAFLVKRLQGRGRGAVAQRCLKAGDVVLVEDPWALVLLDEELGERCDFCLIEGQKLLRCPSTGLCFLSKEEQRAAAVLYYRAELKAAQAAAKGVSKGRGKTASWPAKLRLALRSLHRGALAGGETPWSSLESHWEELDSEREQLLEEHAARCLDCVAAGLGLLGECEDQVAGSVRDEARRAFQHMADIGNVARFLAALDVNAMTVTDEELRDVGLGLYLKGASFNHAEEPNCVQSFSGRRLVIRAVAPVAEGEELTVTYADLAELSSARRARLRSQYHFDSLGSGIPPKVAERDAALSLVLARSASGVWHALREEDGEEGCAESAAAFVREVRALWSEAQAARLRGTSAEQDRLLQNAWATATKGDSFRLGEGHGLRLALARELMDRAVASNTWDEARAFARSVCDGNRLVHPPAWPVTCLSLARLAKLELYHGDFAGAIRACREALRGRGPEEESRAAACWEDRPKAAEELRQILAEAQAEVKACRAHFKAVEGSKSKTETVQQAQMALTGAEHETAFNLESLD
eukprot:TRINITY_DN106575_c0_g1_i1.p1 TRINITY_DN106575_c0_g1~~TRINITY_DN106575_c0_g1_i1.p1  ORF type:complete len:542 (+),score=116.05 TRINITY_DN106575_c0_g1_i1:34-1659(+)